MWDLVPLKEKRKYQIIESLFTADKPLTVRQLAEISDSSTRGVGNYLKEIGEEVAEIDGEMDSSIEGMKLKLPENIGIDYFKRTVFKNTPGLILLEIIFFDESLTTDEIEEELSISTSTLNRLTKSIQEALKNYGIELETNPLRVVGSEWLVRNFYSMFFWEAYSPLDWPFDIIQQSTVDVLMPASLKSRHTTSDITSLAWLRFDFAIGAVRSLNGYHLEASDFKKEEFAQFCKKKEEKRAVLERTLQLKKFAAIYAEQQAYLEMKYSKKAILENYKNNPSTRLRIEDIEKLIQELSDLYQIPTSDHTALIVQLDYTLDSFKTFSHKNHLSGYLLFKPNDSSLLSLYKKGFPTFTTLAYKGLENICKRNSISASGDFVCYLLHLLLSQWEGLTQYLVSLTESCKLLIYSHNSYRYAQNIENSIKNVLHQTLEVSIYDEAYMNKDLLKAYEFDILVSTTTLSLDSEQAVVFLYGDENGFRYDNLMRMINQIIEKKKRNLQKRIQETVLQRDIDLFK